MTDEHPDITDDQWIDALEGKASGAGDDARMIRAALQAQDELTAERISDADVEAAKQRLLDRLRSDSTESHGAGGGGSEDANVVDFSARASESARTPRWRQSPGMLLAASVAFVAVVIMVLRNPDVPDGSMLILSYGEIDTMRGASDETIYRVADPDAFGRELGATLIEREIPFVLVAEDPESPDRIISIQIDGVENIAGVQMTLDELGLDQPTGSVVNVRLVPE